MGCWAGELPESSNRLNLAAGKKVLFAPAPVKKPNIDASLALTDGQLMQGNDKRMWIEPSSVDWSYPGRANLALNLEKNCELNEIGIRFSVFYQDFAHTNIPGWIEAFVSDDGIHYKKVAERSRWDDATFFNGVDSPINDVQAGVYYWRFANLENVRGRYVGLRFSGGYRVVSDQLYVFGKEATTEANVSAGAISGFSVMMPQPYFHKPELVIPTNITAPQPLGITTPDSKTVTGTLTLEFDVPAGLVWDAPLKNVQKSTLPDGGIRYSWKKKNPNSNRLLTSIYLSAPEEKTDTTGTLRYRYSFENWHSPELSIPYRVADVPAVNAPKRLLTTFGWWRIEDTLNWPDALTTFKHVGMNAISLYGSSSAPDWMPADHNAPAWKTLEEARQQGFKLFGADATYNTMVHQYKIQHPEGNEIYCQFEDGTAGKILCPSYRGQYYRGELERYSTQVASVKPEFTTQDIEQWPSAGPIDAKKCTRCLADFKASGLKDWDDWVESKGSEMWTDAINAARGKLKQAGASSDFITGGYYFQAGKTYTIFNFDKLYPEYLQLAQPSYYSSYYPVDLMKVVDQTRESRKRLPRSDVMPILSPGDAGPIPGDAFQWAILESYCNGARGVLFWSQRSWDAEYLIAYSNAIRAITPVEDIIMDGDLIGDAVEVENPCHLSGMRQGNNIVLLVSDYQHASDGILKMKLQLNVPSQICDLMTGQILEKNLSAGNQNVSVPLNGTSARLIEVKPL